MLFFSTVQVRACRKGTVLFQENLAVVVEQYAWDIPDRTWGLFSI